MLNRFSRQTQFGLLFELILPLVAVADCCCCCCLWIQAFPQLLPYPAWKYVSIPIGNHSCYNTKPQCCSNRAILQWTRIANVDRNFLCIQWDKRQLTLAGYRKLVNWDGERVREFSLCIASQPNIHQYTHTHTQQIEYGVRVLKLKRSILCFCRKWTSLQCTINKHNEVYTEHTDIYCFPFYCPSVFNELENFKYATRHNDDGLPNDKWKNTHTIDYNLNPVYK